MNTCIMCREPYHRGKNCPKDEDLDKLLKLAKKNDWKQCPRCGAMVERKGGCPQMKVGAPKVRARDLWLTSSVFDVLLQFLYSMVGPFSVSVPIPMQRSPAINSTNKSGASAQNPICHESLVAGQIYDRIVL